MRKLLQMLFVLIIGLLIFVMVIVFHLGPNGIIRPYRGESGLKPEDFQLSYDSIKILTEDRFILKGYWVKTKGQKSKGVVVCLHGVGDIKESHLASSEQLAKNGFESIVFDSRAHGQSEGTYCTYGYYEKQDLLKIVDLIRSKSSEAIIGVWGRSMGGAVALQAMALSDQISFGVIESTFTEFKSIVRDYQKRIMSVRVHWMADFALKKAGQLADFYPDEVSPVTSIRQIEQPLLLIHGDSDPKVATKYTLELYEAATTKNKKLLIIEGANHDNVWSVGGQRYLTTILRFFDDWSRKSDSSSYGDNPYDHPD